MARVPLPLTLETGPIKESAVKLIDPAMLSINPGIKKMLCAPCSNCKGQLRDLFNYYDMGGRCGIGYTGLVEFIVNAMPDMKVPFINLEEMV